MNAPSPKPRLGERDSIRAHPATANLLRALKDAHAPEVQPIPGADDFNKRVDAIFRSLVQ